MLASKLVWFAQEYADKALLRDVAAIDSFVELHIEQGPALEAEGLQVGIVEAIMAPSLVRVEFTGRGGHGGGMPMSFRCTRCTQEPRRLVLASASRASQGLLRRSSHVVLLVQERPLHGCI